MDSMTGYGSHSLEFRDAVISVQARSVNQKGLQVVFRLPPPLAGMEEESGSLVRERFERGRIEVSAAISMGGPRRGSLRLDPDAVRSYLEASAGLATEFGVEGTLDASAILGMPGVMVQPSPDDLDEEALLAAALECVTAALDALARSRREEGERIRAIFREKLSQLSESAGPLLEGQEERVQQKFARLGERVALILGDTRIDEDRLMSELAIMADRLDITEEQERLETHIAAASHLLEGDSGGCGRKLGFLFQEMLRELNTMGAKVDDADAQKVIVSMKDLLGGMREQVANVE
jgi:uncharacterized protein (TIGR00255 family)